MLTRRLTLTMAAAVALGTAGAANAQVITQTMNAAQQGTNFTTNLVFNKFDPLNGTLNSIDFLLNGTALGDATLSFTSAAGTYTFTAGAVIQLKRPGGASTLVTILPSVQDPEALGAIPPNPSYHFASQTTSDSNSLLGDTLAADLAAFTGAGQTVTLPFIANGASSVGGPGTATATISTSAFGSATVVYHYSPTATTPEPGSIALLASAGLVGGGLIRRRRATK